MPILHWLNREESMKEAARVPYRLLEAVPELSYGDQNSENMLIHGNNLDALKALLPYYAGRVKCIYIDPPYNTGNAFEHYEDSLENSIWLSLMWSRLELLRGFLTDDGYLAVQIDDKQYARLYLVMCEIFGESKLKTICVKMSESSGLKMGSVNKYGVIPKLKEYIIIAKQDGVKNIKLDPVPKDKWDTEYNIFLENFSREHKDRIDEISNAGFISDADINELDKIADNINLASVAEKIKELKLSGKAKEKWLFENAYRICECATSASVLKIAEKKRAINSQDVFFVSNAKKDILYMVRATYSKESKKPRVQLIFAEDNLAVHPGDLWTDIKTTGLDAEGDVEFKNGKKPEQLVSRIIRMATTEGDIVLDSFLGSGTTAAVAHKLKRRYIGIEMGEQARTHCAKRLRKVIDGSEQAGISESANWKGGGGFRFYNLGEAIFDGNGNISLSIKFPHLAAHIWFSETRTPYIGSGDNPFLGEYNGTGYYLLYNGILGDERINGGNVLTNRVLDGLANHSGPKIIYGEKCQLSDKSLAERQITFKQTPYDIRAR